MKNITKAETLNFLSLKLKKDNSIIIPKLIFFEKKDFGKNKSLIISEILKKFSKNIIIRSSAVKEDGHKSSLAGKYKSLKLKNLNRILLEEKITKIIDDFKNKKDQVIVQDLVENMQLSGVIFTKDPITNSDYYIINYDTSGKTDLVTSGSKNISMKTIYVYKNKINYSKKFYKILKKIKKIEIILKNYCLDIEFGIKNNKLFIFQCRPLINTKKSIKIGEHLTNIKKKIIKINHNPYFNNKKTILSNMADWNPAEMIGSQPKPLAISLYSELITNEVWAKQRKEYGYLDVRPNTLMYNIYGKPFIDVRTDFNSFMPVGLNEKLSKKIIGNRVNYLSKNKYLHDKIEFEVIETCFNFKTKKNLEKYLSKKDSKSYIYKLKFLTKKIISKDNLKKEKNKLDKLFHSIKSLNKKKLSHIQNIFFLIQICKNEGTLPFAGLARCAFIGTSILNSLVKMKILSNLEKNKFYESINSISKNIKNDSINIWRNRKLRSNFINKYGHLRPLTYSINSKNYKENLKNYFPQNSKLVKKKDKKFSLNYLQKIKVNNQLKKEKLNISSNELFDFIKRSIKYREYGKYVFSKCINEIFLNLISLAKETKINRNEIDYIDIDTIIKSYNNLKSDKLKKELRKLIIENKKKEFITKKINLPDVISSEKDIYAFETSIAKGNFFSNKNIITRCKEYNQNLKDSSLKNKIILIENADPGYDFIFNKNISGLITRYGGANSHMSIRCMEENLPACIGIGESKFNMLKNSKIIELNCSLKIINIIL